MKEQLSKLITGMAGEYLVAGQMSLRGWTANLTYKNYPGVDIIGQHSFRGDNTIAQIQVKASVYPSFWVGIRYSERPKMDTIIKGPYVLVYFEDKDGNLDPSYYILTKRQMIDLINQSDEAYRNKPRGDRQLSPDYSIKLYIKRDNLEEFKDKWENLFVA